MPANPEDILGELKKNVKEAFAIANASLHKGDGRNVHVQTKGCMFDYVIYFTFIIYHGIIIYATILD